METNKNNERMRTRQKKEFNISRKNKANAKIVRDTKLVFYKNNIGEVVRIYDPKTNQLIVGKEFDKLKEESDKKNLLNEIR